MGSIHGGEAAHLMASKVSIRGTYRWIVERDRRRMERYIKNLVKGMRKISGTKIHTHFTKGPQLRVGDTALTSWALPTLVRSLGKRGVLPADPLSNPGDFTLYHKELPTAMFLLGCSKRNRYAGRRGTGNFTPDEETISVGMHVLSNLLFDYLTAKNPPGKRGGGTQRARPLE
ncbi:MAG: hypothetical protein CSA75_05140 [Sorangium cellulosum]|nr:MAG: hypothetical protein CSA75_05140 [Sorangium cellulosum]